MHIRADFLQTKCGTHSKSGGFGERYPRNISHGHIIAMRGGLALSSLSTARGGAVCRVTRYCCTWLTRVATILFFLGRCTTTKSIKLMLQRGITLSLNILTVYININVQTLFLFRIRVVNSSDDACHVTPIKCERPPRRATAKLETHY